MQTPFITVLNRVRANRVRRTVSVHAGSTGLTGLTHHLAHVRVRVSSAK